MPAPTWPPSLPARPPSMTGVIPVSFTLKMSMPTGEPRKPKYGIRKSGCSATVISYISAFIRPHPLPRPPVVALHPNRGGRGDPAKPDSLGDVALPADPLDVIRGEAV